MDGFAMVPLVIFTVFIYTEHQHTRTHVILQRGDFKTPNLVKWLSFLLPSGAGVHSEQPGKPATQEAS